jgi:cytochrome c
MKHLMLSVTALAALLSGGAPAFAQSGSAERGARVFNQQCKACHTVEKGGGQPLGPNLFGMFGRKAGAIEGFKPSDAMRDSGIIWDDANVAEYLRDPKVRVPGTIMAHAGLKRADQLADVIAYLRKATQ